MSQCTSCGMHNDHAPDCAALRSGHASLSEPNPKGGGTCKHCHYKRELRCACNPADPHAINPHGGSQVTITLHSVMRPQDVSPLLLRLSQHLTQHQHESEGKFTDPLGVAEWKTMRSIDQLLTDLTGHAHTIKMNNGDDTDSYEHAQQSLRDLFELRQRLGLAPKQDPNAPSC